MFDYNANTDTADFYPRSPRGERQARAKWARIGSNFYPRSPRGERLAVR